MSLPDLRTLVLRVRRENWGKGWALDAPQLEEVLYWEDYQQRTYSSTHWNPWAPPGSVMHFFFKEVLRPLGRRMQSLRFEQYQPRDWMPKLLEFVESIYCGEDVVYTDRSIL